MSGKGALRWEDALAAAPLWLYAGDLLPELPQYQTHIGLTPYGGSPRTICHDLCDPMPIPDGIVDVYQAEDVFEHIPYDQLPAVIADIHRGLKPGGLFRLSVPDYRFDHYMKRSLRDADGRILFDPGGGGRYENDQVVDGGHVWFPVFELVEELMTASPFAADGRIDFRHYTAPDGSAVMRPIDYALGNIQRTPDHDPRAQAPRRPMSIVVDAWKAPDGARNA